MAFTSPRLIIAGVSSGVGKTTITMALIAHLRTQGLRVQPFKVGPDYLDPSHLAIAASMSCYNLDSWMMPPERMRAMFTDIASSADISIIEGVMGLYDGYSALDDTGSTAEVAKLLNAPVILVVDAGAMARSAAAVVLGFQRLDPQIQLAGVIVNRVGGAGHAVLLREAIEAETGIPLLGYLSSQPDVAMPERHLGLLSASEHSMSSEQIQQLGAWFSQTCDTQRLLTIARTAPAIEQNTLALAPLLHTQPLEKQIKIAIAEDEAFHFYYPDTLALLRQAGAELVPFSPLHDATLPDDIHGLYIGGGFPEEYAPSLSANEALRVKLAELLRDDIPCYAECGGLMYLCQAIRIPSGEAFPMVGRLSRCSIMSQERGLTIGYREVTAARDSLLLKRGEVVRGHEFHVSYLDHPLPLAECAYESTDQQPEGFVSGNLLASYIHLSFSAFPLAAQRFVEAAQLWHS